MANLKVRREEPRERGLSRMGDPLRAWDPFRMIREMMTTPDVFGALAQPASGPFIPDIEVKETKDAFVVCADLPGVKEDDIQVDVIGNQLSVSGEREEEHRDEGDRVFAYERSYGAFRRSLTLPEGADMERVEASLRSGVLEIRVPKHAAAQPRRVPIGEQKEAAAGKEPKAMGEEKVKKAA